MAIVRRLTTKYPVVRGMLAYATLWPLSSIVQQTITGRTWETYDLRKAFKFGLFGSLVIAPTIHYWIQNLTRLIPQKTIKYAIIKAYIDQVTYGPAALIAFFIVFNLMEGHTFEEAREQLKVKFWPAYKVGACYWFSLKTANYLLIPNRNKVLFVCCCSFVWCIFLAFVYEMRIKKSQPDAENISE